MKRILLPTLILIFASLACQAAQPSPTATPAPTSTSTPSPTPTLTPTPTFTPLPPTPQPITCTDDSCLEACIDRIKVVLATQPFASIPESQDASRVVELAKYKVSGDVISPLGKLGVPANYVTYQQDVDAHQRIWNYFTAILPAGQRERIHEYLVFTDGKSDIQAWVKRSPSDPAQWSIGADILDSRNPVLLTETLVHEFAHLLTLNTDQLEFGGQYSYVRKPGVGACPNYSTRDGCTNKDSYLNQFYLKFWRPIYPEWYENLYQGGFGLDWGLVSGFYRRYPDQFNTTYSAASPEEDMAESFAVFILSPRPDDLLVSQKKILFFYEYPELVTLRQEIIQGICAYVQE